METRKRSIVKAVTWRAGGLVVTVAVAWVVTGRADVAASVGILDTVLKVAAYYVHERLWARSAFGRPKPPDYQI